MISKRCNEVVSHDFLMAVTRNFNTNTLQKSAASSSFPEDEVKHLLRNIGKSLQDQKSSRTKKKQENFHNNKISVSIKTQSFLPIWQTVFNPYPANVENMVSS